MTANSISALFVTAFQADLPTPSLCVEVAKQTD